MIELTGELNGHTRNWSSLNSYVVSALVNSAALIVGERKPVENVLRQLKILQQKGNVYPKVNSA